VVAPLAGRRLERDARIASASTSGAPARSRYALTASTGAFLAARRLQVWVPREWIGPGGFGWTW